jgi:GNAT superfamily N-acetyltransferase
VTVQVEQITDEIIEEIKPLIEEHWEEIAENKDIIKLNPDFEWYKENGAAGILHLVTARTNGDLQGYFLSCLAPNPHYKDHIFAQNDILFVRKDYRGTNLPVRMFLYAEEKLKEEGVSVLSLHMKVEHPFVGFAEKLGYKKSEYNFTKVL